MAASTIEPGVEYPIELGASFDQVHGQACSLSIVRYDFIPASAAQTGQGKLTINEAKHQATITLPNVNADGAPVQFTGKYESNKDQLECVAFFDGQKFRLDLLSGHATVRHAPGVQRRGQLQPPIKVKPNLKFGGSRKGAKTSKKSTKPEAERAATTRSTRNNKQTKDDMKEEVGGEDIAKEKDGMASVDVDLDLEQDIPDANKVEDIDNEQQQQQKAQGVVSGAVSGVGVFTTSDAKDMSEMERSFFLGDDEDV